MSTDDSFHPLGEEWEAELKEKLDETEYDTDLGLEMAEDAQRLVAGEITEEEFHAKYHDAVVEEFGVDDRPTAEAWEQAQEGEDGTLLDRLAKLEGDGDVERREVMKKMGAGAAFLGLAGWATKDNVAGPDDQAAVAAAEEDEDGDVQLGMVIDLENCDGCLTCVAACAEENQTSAGANWMYVFHYEDDSQEDAKLLVRTCQHCSDAPCEKVCPTTARHTRSKDGLVLTDYDVCIGCRYCQVACPYGVNYFQWGEPDVPMEDLDPDHLYDERGQWVDSRPPRGVMGKCTMCPTRQDGYMGEQFEGTTACQINCPPQVIKFGDMNDPDSEPREFLREVQRREIDDLDDEELQERLEEEIEDEDGNPQRLIDELTESNNSTFRLLEDIGTDPNVVFVGNEPGPKAEQISGEEARERGIPTAVSYEELNEQNDDLTIVDKRKEVLDEQTLGGGVL